MNNRIEKTINKSGLTFNVVKLTDEEIPNWYFNRITITDEEGDYVQYTRSYNEDTSYISKVKIANQKLYRNHNHDLVKSGRGRVSKHTIYKLNILLNRIDELFSDREICKLGNISSIQTGFISTYGWCGVRH